MKMVAGARLNRAQQRILALRPYATKTQDVLRDVVSSTHKGEDNAEQSLHPLLQKRPEKRVVYLLVTSDRGLCGAFNTNLNKTAERCWRADIEAGKEVSFYIIGRKGRDYLRRRNAPIAEVFSGVWEKLDLDRARAIVSTLLKPFQAGEVDAIYLIFSQFKSAISQEPIVLPLLPVGGTNEGEVTTSTEFLFEPDPRALLNRLIPMYLEITILRALYDSQASELGARMTAMDAATKNAKEMIASLTLQYNRARQAAITKELMEIIGGAEALKE